MSLLHVPLQRKEDTLHYKAYLFGPFLFFRQGQLIEQSHWRGKKVKTLLKLFLMNPGKIYSTDQLIDLLWPDLDFKSSVSSLHVTLHNLRRLLEPTLTSRQPSRFIHHSAHFYWFEIDDSWWVDTLEVQNLFQSAKDLEKAGNVTAAASHYRRVMRICQRDLLPEDSYEDWCLPYQRQYQFVHSHAVQKLIQFHYQHHDFEGVIEYANEALYFDPYSEPAMKAIVDAYVRQGNMAKALQEYERFRAFLSGELGIEPCEEMKDLRAKIAR
ncbi:AfsR/SARP family transcriptional regulator [Tengunoibacter tsumagoiensis]|uniref:Bacterial transcriptional activator domain-containing protein n=1 Tax=Tengunoibacter tsumagoiensis TaxID=2014871 RepID=A0A402A9E9_9CHLR|nr:BTAD domain-containing putative transcriptional regulator [Tengunoibacter tsumagoiensis]GCE15626.1 hypothetical protein KTT_54850 [Tengunoibacter tsumagoiensis]